MSRAGARAGQPGGRAAREGVRFVTSDVSELLERARGEARTAARAAMTATNRYVARTGRDIAQHRTELLFLAGVLGFALVVGLLGLLVLRS